MSKIAYVHDRIVFPWWAENVFSKLIDESLNPSDTWIIFTLFSPHDSFHDLSVVTALPTRINIFFNWTQKNKVLVLSSLFDYRNLMPFYPILCRLLQRKIKSFDPTRVVVSSFAAAKNIVPSSWWGYTTSLYLHSPNQYIRENYDEYCQKLTWYKKILFKACSGYLRKRDSLSRQYNTITTNSQYTKSVAIKLYGIDTNTTTVRYPSLPEEIVNYQPVSHFDNYFIFIWRLVTFVRELDRIILLANELQLPLLIMGDGPDREMLQDLAGPTITFLGNRSDPDEKYEILRRARWLINLTKESCGIVTMEALALGVPVFGYNDGWTAEFVTHKKNWRLVDSKKHIDLIEWFEKFQQVKFERKRLIIQSKEQSYTQE